MFYAQVCRMGLKVGVPSVTPNYYFNFFVTLKKNAKFYVQMHNCHFQGVNLFTRECGIYIYRIYLLMFCLYP